MSFKDLSAEQANSLKIFFSKKQWFSTKMKIKLEKIFDSPQEHKEEIILLLNYYNNYSNFNKKQKIQERQKISNLLSKGV